MTVSSGPRNLETTSSGRTKDRPDTNVMPATPLSALTPPPPAMTIKNGTRIINGTIWNTVVKASGSASSPVTACRVTVGMPTEPNAVGKALAIMQTTQASIGFMPMPASMLAGMAIAVPKPAMPSRNPPKHHPTSRMRRRLSAETPVSIRLMISIAPVFKERL